MFVREKTIPSLVHVTLMNVISLAFPVLYFLLVLALCVFLLVRGIAHYFVAFFAAGALIHLVQSLGFLALQQAPGGFGANSIYLPLLSIVGALGTVFFGAGFIALTLFLLRPRGGAI